MFLVLFYMFYSAIVLFAIVAFSMYLYEFFEKGKKRGKEYDEVTRNAILGIEEKGSNR